MLYSATKLLVGKPKALSGLLAGLIAGRKLWGIQSRDIPGRGGFAEPRRLSLSEQWDRLANVVRGAATRAEEAARCHASATLQVDLAQYALSSLVDELAAVMDVGDRRRPANVHILELQPTPPLSPRPFGDAIAA